VHAAYGVASCFLSAVQTAQGTGARAGGGAGAGEGHGAEDPLAALICDENVTLTLICDVVWCYVTLLCHTRILHCTLPHSLHHTTPFNIILG
jgi:hypothetical protein